MHVIRGHGENCGNNKGIIVFIPENQEPIKIKYEIQTEYIEEQPRILFGKKTVTKTKTEEKIESFDSYQELEERLKFEEEEKKDLEKKRTNKLAINNKTSLINAISKEIEYMDDKLKKQKEDILYKFINIEELKQLLVSGENPTKKDLNDIFNYGKINDYFKIYKINRLPFTTIIKSKKQQCKSKECFHKLSIVDLKSDKIRKNIHVAFYGTFREQLDSMLVKVRNASEQEAKRARAAERAREKAARVAKENKFRVKYGILAKGN